MRQEIKYFVITPVRDEAAYIEKTIQSMISQRTLPKKWLIVDDGSTDGTERIIEKYCKSHDWIWLIKRENRGYRKAGSGVVEAFYDGYDEIKNFTWNFLVKLDGDLEFDPFYFEKCLSKFYEDSKLGIGGGIVKNHTGNGYHVEKNPKFHVRGASKIYRRDCWEVIGGIEVTVGWDTIDEVKANMFGWKTKTFEDIEIIQNKMTGSADGQLKNYIKNGKANYICGYHPIFMHLKIIKRVIQKPYLVGSVGLLIGYLFGQIGKTPRHQDSEFIKYLRKQQINKLSGKDTIWK